MVTPEMVVVYRKLETPIDWEHRLHFYRSLWVGPFLNFPSDFNDNECCWIVPGTVNPED